MHKRLIKLFIRLIFFLDEDIQKGKAMHVIVGPALWIPPCNMLRELFY